jgi:3D (Asp-Asp-Asp) domain-containing protein
MKIKFFTNVIKLSTIALTVLIISKIISVIILLRSRAYISTNKAVYTIVPYRSIPLRSILDKNNILLSCNDIISQDINKPVKPLQTIKITCVTKLQKEVTEKFPFKIDWRKIYSSNLRKVELQKGTEKNVIRTIEEVFYDGVFRNASIIKKKIKTRKYCRLILFGVNNEVENFYDLSKSKKIKMVATAYYPGDPLAYGDGTVIFLGQKMRRGIVAVDPKVIPLKTRIFIPGYGYGYAGDTGNSIKGKRIDLGVNNVHEERPWMFRSVTVYILGKSNNY